MARGRMLLLASVRIQPLAGIGWRGVPGPPNRWQASVGGGCQVRPTAGRHRLAGGTRSAQPLAGIGWRGCQVRPTAGRHRLAGGTRSAQPLAGIGWRGVPGPPNRWQASVGGGARSAQPLAGIGWRGCQVRPTAGRHRLAGARLVQALPLRAVGRVTSTALRSSSRETTFSKRVGG
jgi:hypothetical protein